VHIQETGSRSGFKQASLRRKFRGRDCSLGTAESPVGNADRTRKTAELARERDAPAHYEGSKMPAPSMLWHSRVGSVKR